MPTEHTSPMRLLAGVGLLHANRAALKLGLRTRVDGWRRAAGLLLRGPRSTFVLSAFGLDPWSDAPHAGHRTVEQTRAHIEQRLRASFLSDPACHVRIRRGADEDRAEPCGAPAYSLSFQDPADGPARFLAPDAWSPSERRKHGPDAPTAPLFEAVCRVGAAGPADLWLRVNHVGADGVPVQELLSRLEASWGTAPVTYPAPEEFPGVCRPVASTDIAEAQAFVDFAPLLAWRKAQNARLPEPMTVSAALLWCLARHPAYADRHAGTTVEVEASGALARGVGVVVVHPAEYSKRPSGLAGFVQAFNRDVALTRARASGSCRTLDAAALLPPRLSRTLLRYALENEPRAFGTYALTVLKDAKVFGAPLGEYGHPDGFIAVGGVALPTRDGRRVGCVTIKGPEAVVSTYPRAIAEAVAACADA